MTLYVARNLEASVDLGFYFLFFLIGEGSGFERREVKP